MNEIERVVEELGDIHDANAWHGPSLTESLAGLSADQAAARPIGTAHSIWEIVNHIAGWENIWRRRFQDDPNASEPEEGDFPTVVEVTDDAWQSTVGRMNGIHQQLLKDIAALAVDQLDTNLPNRDYTFRFLLRGAVRHHVYHAGQIALLRKAFSTL
jgi:uncharacterized damage-inducible protein DinB